MNRKMLLALAYVIVLTVGAAQVIGQTVVTPFPSCRCDLDGSGAVNLSDVYLFGIDYWSGTNPSRSNFDNSADGKVNVGDIPWMAVSLGLTGCPQ